MIRDGKIAYASSLSTLLGYRPGNLVAYSISLALMATLISYQAASLLVNLLQGIKPRGQSSVSELNIRLLMHSASPLAIFRSFFPHVPSWCSSPDRCDDRNKSSSSRSAVTKLIVMLAIAPLCNIVTVVLTFERDAVLSVDQAELGGLALSLVRNPEFSDADRANYFLFVPQVLPIETQPQDTALATFSVELGPALHSVQGDEKAGQVTLEIYGFRHHEVMVKILTPQGVASRTKSMQVSFKEGPESEEEYYVKYQLNQEDIAWLLDSGTASALKMCKENTTINGDLQDEVIPSEKASFDFFSARRFKCTTGKYSQEVMGVLMEVVGKTLSNLEIAESPSFELASVTSLASGRREFQSQYFTPGGFAFLRRRTTYASFWVHFILLAVVTTMRIISAIISRNDLSIGTELIVKKALGIPWSHSLLTYRSISIRHGHGYPFVSIERN